jgi:excisionase family DNA binding protein
MEEETNRHDRPILTVKEAAEYMTISLSSLYALIKSGNGPKVTRPTDKRIGFLKESLDEYLKSKTDSE